MANLITGLHHVTAIASDAQQNIDFYAGVLGLKLVKKTVNFDASDIYHFYYGDETGSPGSLLTFFPYSGLVKGRHGKGLLNTTTFSVPAGSLDYWVNRLQRFDVSFKNPQQRLSNEVFVYLEDPDGLGLELVFNDNDRRPGFTTGAVPVQHAVRGLFSVEIWLDSVERTVALLTHDLNHTVVAEQGGRIRLAAADGPGNFVDLIRTPESLQGRPGSGTVHHLAFATPTKETELAIRERMLARSMDPTPVKDRNYFQSIYFREPGGVLFEVATSDDSFAKDESLEQIGKELKLPAWFEKDREAIVRQLPSIRVNPEMFQ